MDTFHTDDKRTNYRQEANFISALTFWWTIKIFKLGKKRDLYETDLPEPLKEHTSSMLGDKIARLWSKEYEHAKIRERKPSLGKVICQCFAPEYFKYGMCIAIMEICVKPLQPLLLGLFIRYFTAENSLNKITESSPTYFNRILYFNNKNQPKIKKEEAICFGFCIVLCSLLSITVQHPYMLAVMHLGMKVRVACTSLMYRKTLRMSMLTLSPTTVGNVMNLISNDATRFDIVTMFLHYLWISPLQFVLFIFILYSIIDVSAFFGACVIMIFIPIQIFLAHCNKNLRWKTAYKTDERVRLMNEIISGIQVIKMYAWEYAFCKLIYMARRKEMKILVQTSYIRGIVMSMIMFTARTATFVTLISMVMFFNSDISAENVFIISGYYIIMRSSMTVFFPQGVTQFAETLITIQRTRNYLVNEDAVLGDPSILNPALNDKPHPSKIMKTTSSSGTLTGNEQTFQPSIRIIEAYAKWSSRYVLRDVELIIPNGRMVVLIGQVGAGKSSLLQVILKELPVCQGYVSIRGRVSYSSEEPWLFAGSVRQNILFGHEYEKLRYRKVCKVCALLKDFKRLPYGDQTIVGERGISLSGGQRARINLARCIYKEADIYVLDDPLSAVDTHVGTQIFRECITEFLQGKIRVLVTHQLQYLHHVDQLIIMEKGRVMATGTFDELKKSGLDFAQYLEAVEKSKNEEDEQRSEPIGPRKSVALSVSSGMEMFYEEANERDSLMETRGTGNIDFKLYKSYWHSGGNWFCITFVIIMFLVTQFFASGTDFLIAQWVKREELIADGQHVDGYLDRSFYIIGYSIVTDLLIFFSIARSFFFFYVCLQASIKLHDNMFNSIAFGQMRFFNTNPSGRILNRFSKDMGAVDEDLPYAMIDFFQMLLNLVGVFLVLAVTNYYLIPAITIILICLYFMRRYYLYTSRSLKRVEGVVRSYVFAHLNASIQGLTTIRSHNAEKILTSEFDKHADVHSSAWYLFIATARAFSLWTDYLCVTLIALSTFGPLILKLAFDIQIMSGDVGLCITQCITLTGLIPWGMRQSAEMENNMTSVERIFDFTNIDREPDLKSSPGEAPPKNWPAEGKIIFKNVELRYSHHEEPVLRKINLTIESQEKIGIVGRTGAGKSSIISALFRLAFQSGAILIDDVNIFNIGLHDLRKRIAIIPQEPVIFTGSLRFNLDPFRQYSDETLLAALSIVDLETGRRDILNKPLVEGGASFSAGQRQLLCLARAIIRNSKILVLDEATANMDAKTDRLIQDTIRKKFSNCTVLTIAHRLHTIMDSDRILVMHAGHVVEFDHPHVLLQQPEGHFTSMVFQTGKATEDVLRRMAKQNFERRGGSQTLLASVDFTEEEYINLN